LGEAAGHEHGFTVHSNGLAVDIADEGALAPAHHAVFQAGDLRLGFLPFDHGGSPSLGRTALRRSAPAIESGYIIIKKEELFKAFSYASKLLKKNNPIGNLGIFSVRAVSGAAWQEFVDISARKEMLPWKRTTPPATKRDSKKNRK
jgi:hypothetical protein